jgi:hypothetical protein
MLLVQLAVLVDYLLYLDVLLIHEIPNSLVVIVITKDPFPGVLYGGTTLHDYLSGIWLLTTTPAWTLG